MFRLVHSDSDVSFCVLSHPKFPVYFLPITHVSFCNLHSLINVYRWVGTVDLFPHWTNPGFAPSSLSLVLKPLRSKSTFPNLRANTVCIQRIHNNILSVRTCS